MPAETGNGFVVLVVLVVSSCGDSVSGRWGTQLDFISRKPLDDPYWSTAFWASSKRTRIIHAGGLLRGWRCRAEKLEAKRQRSGTAPLGGDGHPFKTSIMAMGDGRHMLPVKVETRQAIGKEVGQIVKVRLEERIRG